MGANNEEVSPQAPLSISNSDVSVTQKHVKLHTQQDKLHNVIIPFTKAHDDAQPPHHATPYAAGGDLHSIESIKILAGNQALVATGLKIALPSGTYGRIAPRSGLAVKHQISVGAGVIDEDYRGEIKVLLINHGKEEFVIQKGERIAQLIIQEIATTGTPVPAVTETVQICRMREDVKKPMVEHSAVKVYSDENGVVPANGMLIFKTGIRIAVPPGYYAHASPLTNLAIAHGIELFAGVIDSDYRGELKVLLFNHSEKDFTVNAGDAVMQILVEKIATPTYEKVTELPETVRGAGGFGSTGISNSNIVLTTDDDTVTKENVVTVPKSVSMKRAVNFLPLVDSGIIPTYESDGAAAADVYSSQPQTVPPHGRCLVNTGLVAVVAPGYYARMAPRSGLAVKNRIHIGAGVQWTSKESAQIQILLYNFGSEPFGIKHGDRIAQVIFEQIAIPKLDFVEELSETERGENGFGSTGVNRIAG